MRGAHWKLRRIGAPKNQDKRNPPLRTSLGGLRGNILSEIHTLYLLKSLTIIRLPETIRTLHALMLSKCNDNKVFKAEDDEAEKTQICTHRHLLKEMSPSERYALENSSYRRTKKSGQEDPPAPNITGGPEGGSSFRASHALPLEKSSNN